MERLAFTPCGNKPHKRSRTSEASQRDGVDYICIEAESLGEIVTDLQDLREKTRRLTLAMATAGHDLRQRLQSLLGTIELLTLAPNPGRAAELSQRAKSLIMRLAADL